MPDSEDSEHRAEPTHREKIAEETLRRATLLRELQDVTQKQSENMAALQAVTQQQSENIGRLVDSVDTLAAVVATKPSKREVLGVSGLISLLTLLVVASMFVVILHNQSSSRSLLHNGNDTLSLLNECVTPGPNPPPKTGHDCYDRTLANSSSAIQAVDCANEAILRYYISSIPSLLLPPVRPECIALIGGTK